MHSKGKTRTGSQNLAILMRMTEEELASGGGSHFIPHPINPTSYKNTNPNQDMDGFIGGPFTLAKFLSALRTTKNQSISEPDGIPYTALCNLSEQHKLHS